MTINSRDKGARGERELAAWLRERGIKARRGQQFSGSPDSPDVVAEMPYHIECKRTEKLSLYKALEQAEDDAGDETPAVVFHRRNGKQWVVIMGGDEWLDAVGLKKEEL